MRGETFTANTVGVLPEFFSTMNGTISNLKVYENDMSFSFFINFPDGMFMNGRSIQVVGILKKKQDDRIPYDISATANWKSGLLSNALKIEWKSIPKIELSHQEIIWGF